MGKIKRLIVLLVIVLPLFSKAQQNPNSGIEVARMQWQAKRVIPPSPDAAELGKYGNVPVSLYTGTPNISIPIFELKGISLSLPVSLSYNASGYKPEDAASWVGSGWALNGGGVITRTAMGNPDKDFNYFGVANVLDPPTSNNVFDYYTYMLSLQDGNKEAQPDVYYYNFAGHTGKFLLKPDYSVFKKERDLSIITPCLSNSCPTSQFTIVDEQGITYLFDNTESTHMDALDEVGNPNVRTYDYVSSWYLTKMTSADGNDIIEFEYHSPSEPHFLYSYADNNLLPNYSVSYTYGDQTPGCCPTNHVNTDNSSIQTPPTVSMTRKFLKKITLKSSGTAVAYIDIISATGQRDDSNFGQDRRVNQLELYSIENNSNRLVKKYSLGYSYFGNTSATGIYAYREKRLRLDNVQEIAADVNTISPPPHVFTYNNDWSPRYTASLDHWGFYNASGNTYMVPNYYYAGSPDGQHPAKNIGLGANREPSLNGSEATLLKKIQYPTGGYTTFEFELNYAKFINDLTYGSVGGVRIKEMIDYSSTNKKAVARQYSYTLEDGSTTSGKTGYLPDYHKITTYHHYQDGIPTCGNGTTDCGFNYSVVDYTLYTITVSTNSIFGLGSFQGSHIGYSRVTESQVDIATGQPLGKTVYNYSMDGAYRENDDDLMNGNLRKQSVYRNDGKLLQETENIYEYLGTDIIKGHVAKGEDLQTNMPNFCRNTSTNTYYNYGDWQNPPSGCTEIHRYPTKFYLSTYTVQNQYKHLTQQITKVYDQTSNSYLTTTKNFTYGNAAHDFPTLIDEITNNGEKIKTSIKYVMDYTGTSNGAMANNIAQMNYINMKGVPVEKLQYREEANGANRRYINGHLTNYVYGQPVQVFFLEAQPLLGSVTPSYFTGAGNPMYYDPHYRLAATMSYDNLVNLTQQAKTNDVATSFIWGYKNRYPVAKIIGKSVNDAIAESGISLTVLNDLTTSESAMRNELNKLRTLSNAFVTTYTYKPLTGISSETDPRGRTIYYEYDGLNRLVLVRDHENKILKRICYNYSGQVENCTPTNTGCSNFTPDWQTVPNSAYCVTSNNVNTGYQTYLQIDANPCSPTYNTTQPVTIYNTTACPLPTSGCSNCTGEDKKCINNVCETGVLKVISSRRVKVFGEPDENGNIPISWRYYCTYAYCFSDHTTSTPYELVTNALCNPNLCQ